MRKSVVLAISLLAVLVLLVGAGAVACGGGVEAPKLGEWTASTGSSQFTFNFTVSPDSTGIAEISLVFDLFLCAGLAYGPISVLVNHYFPLWPITEWPITDGKFTVNVYIKPSNLSPFDVVIQGMFDESGTHAAGTWEISASGTNCQGTWEASPSS